MDEVTLVKTWFRKKQWKKLIFECQNSGIKVEDWCAQHSVTKHAYYYWLRKIPEEACEDYINEGLLIDLKSKNYEK